MKHNDCIFACEDDCPKHEINLTCDDCFKNKTYEVIEKAVRDFTGLGESYTKIFSLLKTLMDADGKTVKIETPVDASLSVNRVMTALLNKDPEIGNSKVYQKLIFYFFRIIIDQYYEAEYDKNEYIH